jgi:hypothetical protein
MPMCLCSHYWILAVICPKVSQIFIMHYVRNTHPRCVCVKNGDMQIMRLHHRVSHYRVNGDARPGTSLIIIHWRRAKLERISHYKTHPRRALRVCVTDLITGWGSYGTNMRHAQGRASPISKKSKTHFILAHRRFNCRRGYCGTNRRCASPI